MEYRDFLDIDAISSQSLSDILACAHRLKKAKNHTKPLKDYVLAMIFYRSSTRTRISFDVAMRQLGGETLLLSPQDMHLARGETLADTARVLSRYVNIVMMRCDDDIKIHQFSDHADIPVINGLTSKSHPCQIMADIMTFEEYRGSIKGKKVTWMGDYNNVSYSWMQASAKFDFEFFMAVPAKLQPTAEELVAVKNLGAKITVSEDIDVMLSGSDLVVTDTWVSMNHDEQVGERLKWLAPYKVDQLVMQKAGNQALFMHCLPAHRGEEVEAEIMDGPQSVVWDEAENRLHVQKAILLWCLQKSAEVLA